MELPFETYERISGHKWPGGRSASIVSLLKKFNVQWKPGSAEANLCLQGILIANEMCLVRF
jgi:hypothetical protein